MQSALAKEGLRMQLNESIRYQMKQFGKPVLGSHREENPTANAEAVCFVKDARPDLPRGVAQWNARTHWNA